MSTAFTGIAAARVRNRNPWIGFALRRSGRFLVSLLVLITASFLIIYLVPGDPVRAALGPSASAELVEQRRESLGLNDPLPIQFAEYLTGLFTGNLGESMITGKPVGRIIADHLPATLELAGLAFLVTIAIAIPLGVVMSALTRGGRRSRAELGFTAVTAAIAAIPEFLLAVGLVFLLGVVLGWVPIAGQSGPDSYIVPVLALAIAPTAFLARLMRVEMLTVLQADYVRTARAKRLPAALIYLRHALPNAVTTTITVGGLFLGGLVAGSVLVESVLEWPGLGRMLVASILAKDYPVAQGLILVFGALVLAINLVVDVALALIDPRSTIREA